MEKIKSPEVKPAAIDTGMAGVEMKEATEEKTVAPREESTIAI